MRTAPETRPARGIRTELDDRIDQIEAVLEDTIVYITGRRLRRGHMDATQADAGERLLAFFEARRNRITNQLEGRAS